MLYHQLNGNGIKSLEHACGVALDRAQIELGLTPERLVLSEIITPKTLGMEPLHLTLKDKYTAHGTIRNREFIVLAGWQLTGDISHLESIRVAKTRGDIDEFLSERGHQLRAYQGFTNNERTYYLEECALFGQNEPIAIEFNVSDLTSIIATPLGKTIKPEV